jgi:hypothetical protein
MWTLCCSQPVVTSGLICITRLRAQSQVDGAHAKDIDPAQLPEFHVNDYSHGSLTIRPTLLRSETK